MKGIVFIFALLVAIVPAMAQTTNTDCRVIGNQISCQYQTQTMPLPALQIRPPAPLLTPEMVALIVERNRAAAEAMRRDVERFTAELSSHDAWVNLKSGNSSHVRMSGDRIYFIKITPPGVSWSSSTECAPAQSPGTWNCIVYSNLSRFAEPQVFRSNKICLLETHETLSTVSLDRITGESDVFAFKDIDWGKCKIKKVERRFFTLIPRGPQQ